MRTLVFNALFISALFFGSNATGQEILDTIFLNNPSFEQYTNSISVPGWTDCGFNGETPFDPQPGNFGCQTRPANGRGYIGMVVRDNETYEAMSQRLTKKIMRGRCYAFSLHLARSVTYKSISRTTRRESYYATPVRLRIWGGNSACQRNELLAETTVITNVNWKVFNFKFEPLRNHQYLILEAFYKTPTLFPYNGNILVDDASHIFEMKCDDDVDDVIAAVEEKVTKPVHKVKVVKPPKKVTKPKVNPPKKKQPTKKVIMPELNEKVHKGQILRIQNLTFTANSAEIPAACNPVLDELYHFLVENSDVRIELGGHTNNRCDTPYCNSLSEKRAKAVADHLIARGISPDRVSYKGYGKTSPIASNSKAEGRLKNQRVEVKVL